MIDPDEYTDAVQRGARRRKESPYAVRARFENERRRVIVTLSSQDEFTFYPAQVEGLEEASPRDLGQIEITPSGFGLHFPNLDADVYLPALMRGIKGSPDWLAKRARQAAADAS